MDDILDKMKNMACRVRNVFDGRAKVGAGVATAYEKYALEEIRRWENPKLGIMAKVANAVGKPLSKVSDTVMDVPGVGLVLSKTVDGLLSVCGDTAGFTVRTSAILKEFREAGYPVTELSHIKDIPLEKIDHVVGYLAAKYKGLALTEGATAGVVGLPGIIVDIPAITTLSMRAVYEYATYYGFDIDLQEERAYALTVLNYASAPIGAKSFIMNDLVKIAKAAASKQAWKKINENMLAKLITEIAKQLGWRLTKAKLAQVVPGVGAVIGGGFNAKYMADVCDAAYHLYRKRFLEEKYNLDPVE